MPKSQTVGWLTENNAVRRKKPNGSLKTTLTKQTKRWLTENNADETKKHNGSLNTTLTKQTKRWLTENNATHATEKKTKCLIENKADRTKNKMAD